MYTPPICAAAHSFVSRFRGVVAGSALFGALCIAALPIQQAEAVETGSPAPAFSATDIAGKQVTLSELKGKTVVLEWFNYGCPFVRKHYDSSAMQALQKEFAEKGVVWLTINSTNAGSGDYKDAAATTELLTKLGGSATHVVLDAEGTIGKSYDAKTTPHIYIIDAEGMLRYQGAIDDNPSVGSNPAEAKNYLRESLTAVLGGTAVALGETKPYGCSVKF